MKVALKLEISEYSPHEDEWTALGEEGDNPQQWGGGADSDNCSSKSDHPSPIPVSGSGALGQPTSCGQQMQLLAGMPSPFYGHQGPTLNQMPSPHETYYPASNWYHIGNPAIPIMPLVANPVYYSQQSFHSSSSIHATMPYKEPDLISSLSSCGSFEQVDGASQPYATPPSSPGRSRKRSGRKNRGRDRGINKSTVENGAWGAGGAAGGGSPPERGWRNRADLFTLHHARGRIVKMAKDRDGSMFIQRRLAMSPQDPSEVRLAYEEALEGIEELWNNVYGNYILQSLLEKGDDKMRDGIGRRIVEGDVVVLSTQLYGCRLIQKAFDTLHKNTVAEIIASVKGRVWKLAQDQSGNHVIQKSVTRINELLRQPRGSQADEDDKASTELLLSSLDIIVDEVVHCARYLAVHPYGCRIVQRLIESCPGSRRAKILDGISEGGLLESLVEHEYGNYVVQRVLEHGRDEDRAAVFRAIYANVLNLSRQKFSSNVVEKMLTHGDKSQRRRIAEEMLNCDCVNPHFTSKCAVVSMAEDGYANYVCRTALDVLEDGSPQRKRMCEVLMANLDELENCPYAKQVVLRIKTLTRE